MDEKNRGLQAALAKKDEEIAKSRQMWEVHESIDRLDDCLKGRLGEAVIKQMKFLEVHDGIIYSPKMLHANTTLNCDQF